MLTQVHHSRPTPTSGWSSRRTAARSTPPAEATTSSTPTRKSGRRRGRWSRPSRWATPTRASASASARTPAGLAISADGTTLVVANNYNDSISVIDTATGTVRYEHDLRPFFANNEGHNGGVGGTFPFAVVVKGNGTAYVSSDRDREVVVVDISSPTAGRLIKRIKLDGNALGMTLDRSGTRLFVARGQRRPGRGDRHRLEQRGRARSMRAPRRVCCRAARRLTATTTIASAAATPAPRRSR